MGLNSFVILHLFTDVLQFKRRSQHDGAAAEGVVVGVGVDAVEDGVGVVALVQEVVEFDWAEALKRDMRLYWSAVSWRRTWS